MGTAVRRRVHHQGPTRQKGGPGEAEATGANPTDRAKCGGKRHLLTAGRGIPIATILPGANRTDMKKLAELLDAKIIDAALTDAEMAALVERHRCRDRGYDYAACGEAAVARGYAPHIPPKRSAEQPLPPPGHPDRHPPRRWVVEVAHSWFNRFRRVLIRWDKQAAHYLAFVQLAAVLISYRRGRHAPRSLG